MTIHDEMDRAIVDGDQLNDGYFNALATLSPIGGVMAWLKSFTGVPSLPDGWIECNGQAISDAASPLNGETAPDLNASAGTARFLRGGTESSAEGGTETHTHAMTGSGEVDAEDTRVYSATTTAASTLPSYHTVVWIMRIK